MKIVIEVENVRRAAGCAWGGKPRLIVEGDGVSFAVPDTRTARHTYTIGRLVDVTISPKGNA